MTDSTYDVFISHAAEDKDEIARPLSDVLCQLGLKVWFDETALELGDSLSRAIDLGLSRSNYGVIVVSPAFLRKPWPEYELRGLVAKEIGGPKTVLPVWYNVTRDDVLTYSPPLADKVAAQYPIVGAHTPP